MNDTKFRLSGRLATGGYATKIRVWSGNTTIADFRPDDMESLDAPSFVAAGSTKAGVSRIFNGTSESFRG